MKNLPKQIYLQIDADGEIPEDFNELFEITWCQNKIHKNDIKYVLSKKAKYWEIRCKFAEKFIEKSPCDPDIYDEQLKAYHKWQDFKNKKINE